jgi:hypothetical protein
VLASDVEGFDPPEPVEGGAPDIVCLRGGDLPPLCIEVELPETLVRKETLTRLRALVDDRGFDLRLVLIAGSEEHPHCIHQGRRMLTRAGIWTPVAALDPDEEILTGADW